MDAAFFSHIIAWFLAAMFTVGGVLCLGALVSMGRSGYRKD